MALSRRIKLVHSTLKLLLRKTASEAEQALKYGIDMAPVWRSFEEDKRNEYVVPVFKKALLYADQTAIKDSAGEYSYLQLYMGAKRLSFQVSNICGSGSCQNVAFLCANNMLAPMLQWACWISGQVVVPLNTTYSLEWLTCQVEHAQTQLIIATIEFEELAQRIAEKLDVALLVVDHKFVPSQNQCLETFKKQVLFIHDGILIPGTLNNDFYTVKNAMLIYNSWDGGKPAGVLLTHRNLDARISSLVNAWKFTSADSMLHIPLTRHSHGCLNMLLCALSVGGRVVMHDNYNSHNVWSTILGINANSKERVNIFMTIPGVYNELINEYEKIFARNSRMTDYIVNYCKQNFRLMVSSAAHLPANTFQRWREITGHNLLHCYGTAETGMAISNSYIESDVDGRHRGPRIVGLPLPHVKIRLVDAQQKVLLERQGEPDKGIWCNLYTPEVDETTKSPAIIGHLQVSGPSVFKNYYNQTGEQDACFIEDFYNTGDVAAYDRGLINILGPPSSDVIEQADGSIISSTAIEAILQMHPDVIDVAVLGLPRGRQSEVLAVLCVLKPGTSLTLDAMKLYSGGIFDSLNQTVILKIVDEITRNSLAEIDKERLADQHFSMKKNTQ